MTTDESDDDVIVTTTEIQQGVQQTIVYPSAWSSADIVDDSTDAAGFGLEPEYREILTETVDRSKWLGAGIKLAATILGQKFEVEKKPKKEVKTTERVIYRKTPKPQKKTP